MMDRCSRKSRVSVELVNHIDGEVKVWPPVKLLDVVWFCFKFSGTCCNAEVPLDEY